MPLEHLIAAAFFAAVLVAVWRACRAARPSTLPRAKGPYRPRPLLTPAEAFFYPTLLKAVPEGYRVFAKVRLLDLVSVAEHDWQAHGRPASGKHVDFVLADSSFNVALVVELDDKSHGREDRKKRDAFVDGVLASAGLPILRVPCRGRYEVWDLQKQITNRIA